MKKVLFYIVIFTIVSCGEFSVNQEVLNEGTKLSGKVDWKSIAGTYLLDKKSLKSLNLAEESKFYFIIDKDSVYHMNKYLDDDTLKIKNKIFNDKITPIYFYDEVSKKLNKDSLLYYSTITPPNRYNVLLRRKKNSKKPFIVVSYFPDLSNHKNAMSDLAYVLKYNKISDEPMSLKELEETNK